ncbi:MAG: tetratricopeptide repeat protein, partial [Pirellulaceae bacterium]|nr:tetratricopeptide repeat protein [Pirellulaceae bacterium]
GPGLDPGQSAAAGPSLGAARGVPGPGYIHYPWQTMLYGHGDAWARARVFILLCRQQQLDAVMLALDAPGRRPSPYPWLPAVLLGEQLFLFDPQLGLPLPGPDGRGIATLAQVREDPALLESLDVGTTYVYPVRANQIQSLMALVDASPPALSRQMEMVERRLAGDDKLVLTVSPSRLARQLADVPGIQATALWDVPFETEQFRAVLPRLAANNPELARELFRGELIYEGSHPLVMGRRLAFRGVFESTPDQVGAKAMFLDSRTPDSIIDNLERDSEARMRIGLEGNLPADPVAARNLLENTRILLRESRQLASFWLGLAQYDTGRYPDAIDWLDKRTLQADPQGRWAGGARYNLGRTYEVLGQFERARELYFADDSPQAHGNRVRARRFPREDG